MHRFWLGAALLFVLSFGLEDTTAPPPIWTYDKPQEWGDYCQDKAAFQSPIFINSSTPVAAHPHLHPVLLTTNCRFHTDTTTVLQESNYRTVEVRLPTNASTGPVCSLFDQNSRELYPFVRFHFHVGPEHGVEGVSADAELHAVFQQSSGKTLVVAVRLRSSKSSSNTIVNFFRATLAAPLPQGGGSSTKLLPSSIGLDDVFPLSDGSYVTYEGSLTTPPCTDKVRWIVFTAVQSIPPSALSELRDALKSYMPRTFAKFGNARAHQPPLGRPVFKFADPTSTTTNRWIMTQEDEDHLKSSIPFTDIVSLDRSFFARHAFGLCIVILVLATIGLFIRLREQPVEVGVSDAAREAATYGTMET
ncbi:carbonic anhydrase, putative [Bodo saltans]|uniref:carbonic anhydrase n=1 Tax=Bodo saltans TaxID=75058 RepID=A0A0S4JAQ0_BODSA|nr:carbonic anhydrase, putative [Bodo saltans]|eukprot:CUG87418.1 carbonic anhydrase, putative [Bodo saltans]